MTSSAHLQPRGAAGAARHRGMASASRAGARHEHPPRAGTLRRVAETGSSGERGQTRVASGFDVRPLALDSLLPGAAAPRRFLAGVGRLGQRRDIGRAAPHRQTPLDLAQRIEPASPGFGQQGGRCGWHDARRELVDLLREGGRRHRLTWSSGDADQRARRVCLGRRVALWRRWNRGGHLRAAGVPRRSLDTIVNVGRSIPIHHFLMVRHQIRVHAARGPAPRSAPPPRSCRSPSRDPVLRPRRRDVAARGWTVWSRRDDAGGGRVGEDIVRKVLVPESVPFAGGCHTTDPSTCRLLALAGVFGGGGLGDLAYRYGYQRSGRVMFLDDRRARHHRAWGGNDRKRSPRFSSTARNAA